MLEGERPEPSLGRRLDEILAGEAGDGLTDDARANAVLLGDLVQLGRWQPAPNRMSHAVPRGRPPRGDACLAVHAPCAGCSGKWILQLAGPRLVTSPRGPGRPPPASLCRARSRVAATRQPRRCPRTTRRRSVDVDPVTATERIVAAANHPGEIGGKMGLASVTSRPPRHRRRRRSGPAAQAASTSAWMNSSPAHGEPASTTPWVMSRNGGMSVRPPSSAAMEPPRAGLLLGGGRPGADRACPCRCRPAR